MIAMKIIRDEAREVQSYFFPYLLQRCLMKMSEAAFKRSSFPEEATQEIMVHRMMFDLVKMIKVKFDKKLLTVANTFTIKHSDAEAIAMYQLLMIMPIPQKQHFDIMLRQRLCDFYFDKLCLDEKSVVKILSDEVESQPISLI